MTHDAQRGRLVVAGEWPRRSDCGGARNLSLSLEVRASDHRRAPTDVGGRLASPLLVWAAPLLLTVGKEAYAAAYYARVELPRDYFASQPWPRWYETFRHFSEFVGWLRTAVADQTPSGPGSIYPIAIWFLPSGNPRVENLVDLFRVLPFDDGVYAEILAEGAARISIAQRYGDILSHEQYAERVLAWVKAGQRQHDVVWDVGPYMAP